MTGDLYVTPGIFLPAEPLEAATAALQYPGGFMYYGALRPEAGWGWPHMAAAIGESNPLNRSNLEVVRADIAAQWPDDVAVEASRHWAAGMLDELRVKVLRDPAEGVTVANLSPAFVRLLEWRERLEGYPVANDAHYSDLEAAEAAEAGLEYCDERGEYQWPADCAARGHRHGAPE